MNAQKLLSRTLLRYQFSIDQHNLTVIEADGTETQPYTVDSLEIETGEFMFYIFPQICDMNT